MVGKKPDHYCLPFIIARLLRELNGHNGFNVHHSPDDLRPRLLLPEELLLPDEPLRLLLLPEELLPTDEPDEALRLLSEEELLEELVLLALPLPELLLLRPEDALPELLLLPLPLELPRPLLVSAIIIGFK